MSESRETYRTKTIVVFEVTSDFGEIDLSPKNEADNWFDSIPLSPVLQLCQLRQNTKKGSARNLTKNNKHSIG